MKIKWTFGKRISFSHQEESLQVTSLKYVKQHITTGS